MSGTHEKERCCPAAVHKEVIGESRSLCPVCLAALPARIIQEGDAVCIRRSCPEHGEFSGLIWKGQPEFTTWKRPKKASLSVRRETRTTKGCPHDCGRCPEHGQHACTVLFEITEQCNLRCPVCFADAGQSAVTAVSGTEDCGKNQFASLEELVEQLHWIAEHAGKVVLQISGGEPTLYPRLPELVRVARTLFPAVQLNTNGLLLADRPELAPALKNAGLSWVFLQFDGSNDSIFTVLRGRPLLRQKLAAVENCRVAGLNVVLVPTVAAGVNDQDLGNLLRLALSLAPTVRGLHLQPMTRSGRNALSHEESTLTLPEVLRALCNQSEGLMRLEHATAPGCEHERCSFHCRYRLTPSGGLVPLRGESACCPSGEESETAPLKNSHACCPPVNDSGIACCDETANVPDNDPTLGGAQRAIDVILRAWQGPEHTTAAETGTSDASGKVDAFDAFIAKARMQTFSVTCMAFQDAWNVDLERLKGCCVHVYAPPDRLVPFCAYNMTALNGTRLHRGKSGFAARG